MKMKTLNLLTSFINEQNRYLFNICFHINLLRQSRFQQDVTLISHNETEKYNRSFYIKKRIGIVGNRYTMSMTATTDISRNKEIEEKLNSLTESFHSTTDSVNRLQQTCANLLLDNTKHYQLDVLNRLDAIENKIENFKY